MAYSAAHHLLSFGGSLPGGESWTMGLRLSGIGQIDSAAESTLTNLYEAGLSDAWAAQSISGTGAKMLWMKLNRIGTDGRYINSWTNVRDYAAPGITPGGSGSLYPNQVSYVVSLTTNYSRGLAHAGRLFFPIPKEALEGGTGVLSSTNQGQQLAMAQAFLNAVNAVGDGTIIIASKESTGAENPVTGVRCGRVLDTMRSRRTSLDEAYMSAALA